MGRLIQLCNSSNCTQCSACVFSCPKHCISWEENSEGFKIPNINKDKCIECGACIRACHQLTESTSVFNAPLLTYAAWSLNKNIRQNSSSGGLFSELAKIILENGGFVFGAAFSDELKVVHISVTSEAELFKLQGSKYVQSDIGDSFPRIDEILKHGKKVLFSGTPCQVAALKKYLKKDYDNLFTIDLICHGVPAQKTFDLYLNSIDIFPKPADVFSFRNTNGWGFAMSYNGHNIKVKDSYYIRAFNRGLMFNEACFNCKYATSKRVGDITLGDFWGLGATNPFSHPKTGGISCVIVNTLKGKKWLEAISNIFLEERNLNEAIEGNHNLHSPSNRPKDRDTYLIDCENLSKSELQEKYDLSPNFRDYFRPYKYKILKWVSKIKK